MASKKLYRNTIKITFVLKGLTHAFWPKNAFFFLYLDLFKIRLEVMLSDIAEKKETFFDLKNANFWLFRFGQNIVQALFAIQVLLSEDFRLYDEEIILCTPSKTSS